MVIMHTRIPHDSKNYTRFKINNMIANEKLHTEKIEQKKRSAVFTDLADLFPLKVYPLVPYISLRDRPPTLVTSYHK